MKRLFLFLLIISISFKLQSQEKKVDVGNSSVFLPKIKGYNECAKSKFSKSYTDVLLPEETGVLGFYITEMAYAYPSLSFFHEGINDCVLFLVEFYKMVSRLIYIYLL